MPTKLDKVVPPLNARRLAVVQQAFTKLDRDGSGVVDIVDLKEVYDVSRHPRVLDGSMSQSMALQMFLNNFEPCAAARDGKVTWDEFQTYYEKVSAEVDLGRELDHDAYFELLVVRAWRLDEPEDARMPETRFIATTDEKPTGLKATRSMHLVWRDPASGTILGFPSVVKPWFARKIMPLSLRQHFAYYDEMERVPHKMLPANGCSLAPLDIVWTDESDGSVLALKGLVATTVDVAKLPDTLRAHIMLPTEAAKLNPSYIPIEPVANPIYKRSNDVYGVGSNEQCQKILELKKATFNGTACGNVFAGKTGKFSNSFGGGMYTNSSLNITMKPK